jgi:hypothetical protein
MHAARGPVLGLHAVAHDVGAAGIGDEVHGA